jgi:hypothetical protein
MNIGRIMGITAAGALGAVMVLTQAAQAQAPYPQAARSYKVNFARAMDECTGGFVTVVNPGGVNGCLQANSTTDSDVTGAIKATLKISRGPGQVRLSLRGRGFEPAGTRIGLKVSLRTSNTNGIPPGSKTFEDQTIICGPVNSGTCGHYVASDATGRISARTTLADCLLANGLSDSLASGNIELLDTSLINCDTGNVIAVPGVLR